MGPMVPMKPNKVNRNLLDKPHRYMWYEDRINLFDMQLVGPFDFLLGYRVPETAWTTLLHAAPALNVYVGAINRIIPLDKPDVQDKDTKDQASSYLAFRWILEDTLV